jgi:hypothetical protein
LLSGRKRRLPRSSDSPARRASSSQAGVHPLRNPIAFKLRDRAEQMKL